MTLTEIENSLADLEAQLNSEDDQDVIDELQAEIDDLENLIANAEYTE